MKPPAPLDMQPIYSAESIRQIERQHLSQAVPGLMERAGAGAAAEALRILEGRRGRVLIVAGPGNNGGDGLVLARHLRQTGFDVTVAFAGVRSRLPPDAANAHAAWQAVGGSVATTIPQQTYSLIVDALFGVGLERPIEGSPAQWIDAMNRLGGIKLALDVPSGLHADSGRVLGVAFRASHTTTFIALKPGLLTLDGPDYCGMLSVHDLGLDVVGTLPPDGRVIGSAAYLRDVPWRPRNSHKGQNGNAVVLGGAPGMAGAALLAGRAALKCGAGRVYVGMIDDKAMTVDPEQPELMLRSPLDLIATGSADALAIGPGLGQSDAAQALLGQCLALPVPVVLDADALNLIAAHPRLANMVSARNAPTLLTPHPAEAARLLHRTTASVQDDRVASACQLARQYKSSVVLKGCGSIVAFADGRWWINTTGNPGMASAGMGDALTGLVVGMLAQKWTPEAALLGGVHLHGLAGDRLVAQGCGPNGLTATELIGSAREVLNQALAESTRST
ncbi:MAG TPA: NAD(P)H-hydrate dehydratase [Rhodocyclaceae bacterium]|nr:NAD(P)H-hydrate dehydratase [Rhodocyclaceae bacterium]